jgi:hypothetical protein
MRRSSHRARAIVAALAASLALATAIGPVAAAQPGPQQVTIVSDMTVLGDLSNDGSFTTSRSPLICRSGVVDDTRLVLLRGSFDTKYVLTVDKTFTCEGRGDIFFRLLVRGDRGVETFAWVILGGTGEYHGLLGLGSGSTVPIEGGVTNTYTGYLFP